MRTVKTYRTPGQDPTKLKYEISAGPHHFISDVSQEDGGEDTGPTPHEFMAAALGSCTAITIQMYANRKKWDLAYAEVVVGIEHEGGLTRFQRNIKLLGRLDDEQRSRLLEIANKCPIHKTLVGKIEVQTVLSRD